MMMMDELSFRLSDALRNFYFLKADGAEMKARARRKMGTP
jgi:hypothetical protein